MFSDCVITCVRCNRNANSRGVGSSFSLLTLARELQGLQALCRGKSHAMLPFGTVCAYMQASCQPAWVDNDGLGSDLGTFLALLQVPCQFERGLGRA